jgi:2-dehydro-3-deoxygluconokinase
MMSESRKQVTMVDILGLGECMIQMDAHGPLSETTNFTRQVGGDVYNTLVAASRLGSKTAFVSRLAQDGFGQGMMQHFVANGVDPRYIKLDPDGRNGLYFSSIKPDGSHEFVYYRHDSAASHLSPDQVTPSMFDNVRIVYASGITQAISKSARHAVLKAFQLAKASGATIAYDPNYRPGLWGNQAEALEALVEVLPDVDILFPSEEDMQNMFGFESTDKIMEYFRLREVPVVVLKQSNKGALLGFKDQQEFVPAFPVTAVQDTVGAGDAFNGGFLHGLIQKKSLVDCARLGARVAAYSVEKTGPIEGLPTWTQVAASVEEGSAARS